MPGWATADSNPAASTRPIFEEFQDILGDLFGVDDAFFGGARRGGGKRGPRGQRGADLRYDMALSFEEAAAGVTTKIRLTRHENLRDLPRHGREARAAASPPAGRAAGAGRCLTSRDFFRSRGRARPARARGR